MGFWWFCMLLSCSFSKNNLWRKWRAANLERINLCWIEELAGQVRRELTFDSFTNGFLTANQEIKCTRLGQVYFNRRSTICESALQNRMLGFWRRNASGIFIIENVLRFPKRIGGRSRGRLPQAILNFQKPKLSIDQEPILGQNTEVPEADAI